MAEFRKKRKKICPLCAGKPVNYKDVAIIAKHQRHVAQEVKRARFMGFVPFCK